MSIIYVYMSIMYVYMSIMYVYMSIVLSSPPSMSFCSSFLSLSLPCFLSLFLAFSLLSFSIYLYTVHLKRRREREEDKGHGILKPQSPFLTDNIFKKVEQKWKAFLLHSLRSHLRLPSLDHCLIFTWECPEPRIS